MVYDLSFHLLALILPDTRNNHGPSYVLYNKGQMITGGRVKQIQRDNQSCERMLVVNLIRYSAHKKI